MLCFEILHNGRRLALAGLPKGVLGADWTWVSRRGRSSPDAIGPTDVVPGLECRVGGLTSARGGRDQYVDWITLRQIRLGDEFTLRVLRKAKADRPATRETDAVQKRTRRGVRMTRCSFCGHERETVRSSGRPVFVMGLDVAICSSCVGVAEAVVESHAATALHFRAAATARCSFCCHAREHVLVARDHGICLRCLRGIVGAV